MKILSGIQPSGTLHLGNYFGAIEQFLNFQKRGDELFIFVADLHALTTSKNPDELRQNIFELAAAFIALGLDGAKTTIYRQSDVPEILELNWVLSCLAPMGLLERAVSFKDKTARGIDATVGLFNYPILMSADILILRPDKIPVGRDQKQHLEIARDLAEKFNSKFGEVLKLPEPETPKKVAIVPGTDGEKMSKSYGNTIEFFAEEKVLRKQIFGIQTDSTPRGEALDYSKCLVFQLFKLFADEKEEVALAEKYRNGEVGYGDAKQILLEKVLAHFAEPRAKFEKLKKDPAAVGAILKKGGMKARAEAVKNLATIRAKIGLK